MSALATSDLPSLIGRLLLAVLFASIFGWERERRSRPAGLRTHILVCVGATMITLVSQSYALQNGRFVGDPGRLSAQIVSGIGFLGAGTILMRGGRIRGLTTAATLWVAAGMGIAVGRGGEYIVVAGVVSLIVLFVLTVVDHLEDRLHKGKAWREVTVSYPIGLGSAAELSTEIRDRGIEIRSVEKLLDLDTHHRAVFSVMVPPGSAVDDLTGHLVGISWVHRVEWDG